MRSPAVQNDHVQALAQPHRPHRRYRAAIATDPAAPDTGDVRNDLIALAMDSLDAYTGPRWSGLASVQEAAARDSELRTSLQAAVSTRFSAPRALLERAISPGELRAELDVDTAITILVGAIFFRLRSASRKSDARSRPSSWTASAPARPIDKERGPLLRETRGWTGAA
jgi:hypothetical protein